MLAGGTRMSLRSSGLRLLPNDLSQRLIDPVLPARPGFLKVIKNVPVNSQRDKLLGIRDRRRLRREFPGLLGCCLETRISRFPEGGGSLCYVFTHVVTALC